MPIIFYTLFAEVWQITLTDWGVDTGVVEQGWFSILVIGIVLMYFIYVKHITDFKFLAVSLFVSIMLFVVLLGLHLIFYEGFVGQDDN